ncbi:hypothetical protein OQA88_452 [Cercophora sp. LCS_1]
MAILTPISLAVTPSTSSSSLESGSPNMERQNSHLTDEAEDDDVYADQDDAQSFIQPAISPVATRLSSPRTPAAEKIAAMEILPGPGGGLSETLGDAESDRPLDDTRTLPPASIDRFPTPWQAGPKRFTFMEPASHRIPSMASVFQARINRSSSISENALKRLSKALPSISIPAGIIPNITTPSFLSSFGSSPQKDGPPATAAPPPPSEHGQAERRPASGLLDPTNAQSIAGVPSRPGSRPQALRRSTSDDSLLYQSLSRVSSFGDDERFAHVRGQVNSRFKAIKDSWDSPTFRMPQLQNFLNVPQKRITAEPTNGHRGSILPSSQLGQRENIHPLDSVLESLTGDVVIMGGYRGSILRSAKPPHRQVWVPVKVGLKIRKVNLEVGLSPEDEEEMEKDIFASGMLQNIGPVDISRRLFKRLRDCENARTGKLRVHDYGYDWRLSPQLLSRKLVAFLEGLPSNQPGVSKSDRGALIIAHSLGGLITRHAVNQRPDLFSGVVYAGAPQRCINVLGPLRNGDAVLLNEKVLTAQVNFSLRTTFAFLPEDGFCFIDKTTKEEYPVDFYSVEDWVKYRLSPCVSGPPLPSLTRSNTFSSFLSLSESLPSLPLRGRSNSQLQKRGVEAASHRAMDGGREKVTQVGAMVTSAGSVPSQPAANPASSGVLGSTGQDVGPAQAPYLDYLSRTLAETKKFRAELAHSPQHQKLNLYPPLAVIYGKDIPTVHAARVAGREGIATADAYDDLVFRGGDGVVLAREAMLPVGYELVKNGRICTDRGHISLLGDLHAVGRALEAVVRGRRKGIGMEKTDI